MTAVERPRCLVIEDDQHVASMLRRLLQKEGYDVDRAFTGPTGLSRGLAHAYSCIILDLMLPEMDGLDVCRKLRVMGCMTPILMLTARAELADRVAGFDHGADDYLGKPFAPPELLARLRALVRRIPDKQPVLETGELTLDPEGRHVIYEGTRVDLGPTEFELLRFLMKNPAKALSRTEILAAVWGYKYTSNIVDVYIAYLREKIDRRFGLSLIETVRGVGYRFAPPRQTVEA